MAQRPTLYPIQRRGQYPAISYKGQASTQIGMCLAAPALTWCQPAAMRADKTSEGLPLLDAQAAKIHLL